jgi:tight adherence protein B
MEMFVLAGVFLGTVTLLVGTYLFLNRRRLAAAEAARGRLRRDEEERTWSILRDESVSSVPFLNRLLFGKSWTEELRLQLRRAGTTLSPGAFVLLIPIGGLIGFLLGSRAGPAFTMVLTGAGALLPVAWLKRRQVKRMAALEAQLPDALDMLVSAMRAGYSFQAAAKFVGEEVPEPLGPEFLRFYDEQRLGVDVRTALIGVQERIDSLDMKMFVTAVLIQRETGGNLSEVLTNISDLMRQRVTVRGEIKTLTAEPKMSARVLVALPIVLFLGLNLVAPEFMRPLIETDTGKTMLIGAAISVALGYMVLMKIADIDY